MHSAIQGLLRSLSFIREMDRDEQNDSSTTVSKLARVYEVARNAMEYRAEHLVRRAAIERILRRKLVFERETKQLAEDLLRELTWATYVTETEERSVKITELESMLEKYVPIYTSGSVQKDWLVGVMSAEIEQLLNPNIDYHRFTNFAFHYLRQNVHGPEEINIDLLLYIATDKVFSLSDEQQVSYHLFRLIKDQSSLTHEQALEETWKVYNQAQANKYLNALMAYVRRNMGPLVLVRDIYFSDPTKFKAILSDKQSFLNQAYETLQGQLIIMKSRISTAVVRSLTYVFLTKMLTIIVFEIPAERLLTGHVNYLVLGANIAIPIIFMLILTITAKLPNKKDQEKLIESSWRVVAEFETKNEEQFMFMPPNLGKGAKVFYVLYALLFVGIFTLILFGLIKLGYNLLNLVIFVFFLSVIAFFAFRIRQTSQVYTFNNPRKRTTSTTDTLMLPVVAVGRVMTTGVARLNFLVFVFDFILEAPFKIILRFIDNWLAFLSARKDEVVG